MSDRPGRQDGPESDWISGRVDVPGGHIAYHRTGTPGPAVVLSHGLTDNGLCWSRTAVVLSSEFDVIMLDARGHGGSSRLVHGDEHDPAADIAAVIESLGVECPVVMGHSMGARATARFAGMFPDVPSRVVLEDPPLLAPRDDAAKDKWRAVFREQVLELRSMSPAEITERGRSRSPKWHDDEFRHWTEAKLQVDTAVNLHDPEPWQEYVGRITAPTLLLHGESGLDGIVTGGIAAEARSINPNITTRSITGAGHNIRRENFGGYMEAVLGFLRAD
ncbi:MAG: alpha/beta fold hydrolase [Ilumatobacteraceae bacterium]